ncbi:MAG: hypothetical protein ACYDCP_11710 [Thermoplasmataceae archaeon]
MTRPLELSERSIYNFEIPLKITMVDLTLETVIARETGKKKNKVNEDYSKKYLKDLVNIV